MQSYLLQKGVSIGVASTKVVNENADKLPVAAIGCDSTVRMTKNSYIT